MIRIECYNCKKEIFLEDRNRIELSKNIFRVYKTCYSCGASILFEEYEIDGKNELKNRAEKIVSNEIEFHKYKIEELKKLVYFGHFGKTERLQ